MVRKCFINKSLFERLTRGVIPINVTPLINVTPDYGTRFCTDWAILNSGSTYSMAQEMFSFLNIPFMDRKTFFKDELAMDTVLEAALQESMSKAIEEEINLASGELPEKQITDDSPINLCCELDGSWGLRSNGHTHLKIIRELGIGKCGTYSASTHFAENSAEK